MIGPTGTDFAVQPSVDPKSHFLIHPPITTSATRFTMAQFIRLPQTIRRAVCTVPLRVSIAPSATSTTRQFHSSSPAQKSHNPRWLSDVQARLKKCQGLDIAPQQAEKAKELSNYVQSHWLELLAGEEGYLTGKEWRGLDKHQVTWGDMVSSAEPSGLISERWLRI